MDTDRIPNHIRVNPCPSVVLFPLRVLHRRDAEDAEKSPERMEPRMDANGREGRPRTRAASGFVHPDRVLWVIRGHSPKFPLAFRADLGHASAS